jgi:hypothetical protein
MNIKSATAAACLAGVALLLFCLRLWQPERQVLRHNEHLLKAASSRNWTRVAEFIDEKYGDRWGHDKSSALSDSREILGQFFVLDLVGESSECRADGAIGTVSSRLKMTGKGSPLAEAAMEEVNALKNPFTFQWTRQSWKPWDWKLTRVDNPDLNLQQGL